MFCHNLAADILHNKCHQRALFFQFSLIAAFPFRIKVNIHRGHTECASLDPHAKLIQFLKTLHRILRSLHKSLQRFSDDHGFILRIITVCPRQRIQPLFLFSLSIQLFPDPCQHFGKFFRCHRFQDILRHFVLECLFCVLKITVTAENDDRRLRAVLIQPLAQTHTVNVRHTDVCQHHINRMFFYKFNRIFSILAITDQFKAKLIPLQFLSDRFPYQDLIIYQQYLIHLFLSCIANLN